MTEITKRKSDENINKPVAIINLPDFNTKIAEIAYYKAEDRCFEPGHELNDWLEAERELLYHGNE